MSDNSIVARRQLLLSGLEKYARTGDFELFVTAEWVLKQIARARTVAEAQARMLPADVARWNAARNEMFQKVVGHLEQSLS